MNIMICDDNLEHINNCENRIVQLGINNDIPIYVSKFSCGEKLLFEIEGNEQSIDLIYMDINMDNNDGIEIAAILRKKEYMGDIVFYTIDKERILDSFDVEPLHYWLKDFSTEEKFEEIFLKSAERTKRRNTEVLMLSCAGEQRRIPLTDIEYFEVKNRIITVYYGGEEFEFYSTLSKIEENLFGKNFIRIHNSYLVNKKYVKARAQSEILLIGNKTLPIGRSYMKKPEVKEI